MPDYRKVTLRRNLQQILHCVQEALSVVENQEDLLCAFDDLSGAQELLVHCRKSVASRLSIRLDD
jgi:hypothetical protein